MDELRPSYAYLARETAKSVGAGLLGSTIPNLASWSGADPAITHAMRDVAVGLIPMIFINALMSSLIPAVLTLRRTGAWRSCAGRGLAAVLAGPASVVLGLALGGTVATLGLIHLVSFAFALPRLAADGVMLVCISQAVLVAALLTPLTIVILSGRATLWLNRACRSWDRSPAERS